MKKLLIIILALSFYIPVHAQVVDQTTLTQQLVEALQQTITLLISEVQQLQLQLGQAMAKQQTQDLSIQNIQTTQQTQSNQIQQIQNQVTPSVLQPIIFGSVSTTTQTVSCPSVPTISIIPVINSNDKQGYKNRPDLLSNNIITLPNVPSDVPQYADISIYDYCVSPYEIDVTLSGTYFTSPSITTVHKWQGESQYGISNGTTSPKIISITASEPNGEIASTTITIINQ